MEQRRSAGYASVIDFVEYVAKNYNEIKRGESYKNKQGGENETFLVQLTDGHNNTLYVQLSRDGEYWNVNSAGIFSKRYGRDRETIWSASEVQNSGSATTGNALQYEPNADKSSSSNGTASNVSNGKNTQSLGNNKTKEKKNTLTPMQQRERALGDYLDFYDYVERMLAASESGLLGEPEVDYNAVNEPQYQLTGSEDVRPATQEEREETAYMADHFNAIGIPTSTDWEEGQRVLDMANGEGVRLQKRLSNLSKASNAIKRWLAEGARGKVFTIDLPEATRRLVRRAMGRDFDSHNITIDGIRHGLKNHGENGTKLSANSIPIREQDAELIPYIMTAPDYVRPGSIKNARESVRFYKTLENGYVVVVEKELDNSTEDLETINIWAELSDVNDAKKTPHRTSETPTIGRSDATKIRRDAEIAIENDEKCSSSGLPPCLSWQ